MRKMPPGKKAAGSANGRQATMCGVPRNGLAKRVEADQRRLDWRAIPTGTEYDGFEGILSTRSQVGCNGRRRTMIMERSLFCESSVAQCVNR